MLVRHNSCPYRTLLDHFCPITESHNDDSWLNKHCTHRQVINFVQAVVRRYLCNQYDCVFLGDQHIFFWNNESFFSIRSCFIKIFEQKNLTTTMIFFLCVCINYYIFRVLPSKLLGSCCNFDQLITCRFSSLSLSLSKKVLIKIVLLYVCSKLI